MFYFRELCQAISFRRKFRNSDLSSHRRGYRQCMIATKLKEVSQIYVCSSEAR